VSVVVRWTGHEARLLRLAVRMSVRQFAEHLGYNDAAVSNWERRGALSRLRTQTQRDLDAALKLAGDEACQRFEAARAAPPAAAAPVAGSSSAAASLAQRTSTMDVEVLAPASGWPSTAIAAGGGRDGVLALTSLSDGGGGTRAVPGVDDPEAFDLWELHEAVGGLAIGRQDLDRIEEGCAALDARYAQLPPEAMLPKVSVMLRQVARILRSSPRVADRRRLCSVAGRLAGLRAWLSFDLAHHDAADAWYDAAIAAAREAEDHALCAWLFGARSLIPSYRHDHRAAMTLIEHGQIAGRARDATVTTWLHALEARSRAGLRDSSGFRLAHRKAEHLIARTESSDRRHGMDFAGERLDLTYYTGTSLLLLHQPGQAVEFLRRSLHALPAAHTKAQAILLLGLATAAAQRRRVEEACGLACRTLAAASGQPIMPVLQRARDLRRQLAPTRAATLEPLDQSLDDFAVRLGVPHRVAL
jgi:transcriptional regulator with XRE-family HTH domain